LRRIGDFCRADLLEFWNHGAGVVVRHDMTRTNRNKIAGPHYRSRGESISVPRGNLLDEREAHIKTLNNQLSTINCWESFLAGALAKQLGDIEVNEVGVMENNRFD
jgi:hypothetical protein